MAKRYEFNKDTKRKALARSGKRCEASGPLYGHDEGVRCFIPLDRGVEFDHYPLPATDKGSDTLENCVSCCPGCHRFKTGGYDVPMQAKDKRRSDKHNGIRAAPKMRGPAGKLAKPQNTASRPIQRRERRVYVKGQDQ